MEPLPETPEAIAVTLVDVPVGRLFSGADQPIALCAGLELNQTYRGRHVAGVAMTGLPSFSCDCRTPGQSLPGYGYF